ncbi:NK-tumor recognition protein [Eurosta solidaginis]|uniref:NK-tumor recognition protein n=1 Tax=Eurosta solidaginis TaxID=178769 RepID=UPI00353060F9
MSVINFKEDCVKTTNITMEEGDSSLEPGEVKTPPHGNEPNNTKQKAADEVINIIKCNKPQNVSHAKSASKQETDKCAEKVRAILELDAIKRKEERERKKEQKSETLLHKRKTKKKDHKKHKTSKHSKRESRKRKHTENDSGKEHGIIKKKTKNKKRKHDEHKSISSHTPAESYEPMRHISSAALPPLEYTSPMINTTPTNFSNGFSGYNNTRPYRSYSNPFMRNYRTDFRHRDSDFTPHNRGRFHRYRSQYNTGFFHANAVEETKIHHSPPPPDKSGFTSELMWTKTKPSISFTYNIIDRHKLNKTNKKERKISEHSGGKKKKHKKSKSREQSSKSSPKLSHKSSKRKKIKQIRKTLQTHSKKQRTFSSSYESVALTGEDDGHTPARDNNTPDIVKNATEGSPYSAIDYLNKPIKIEKDVYEEIAENKSKVGAKTADSSKSQVLDMFASLTPPQQNSPSTPTTDSKSTTNISSNFKITNKLQEIQCRVDKLLEDDDLKLESIQATKDKLLQKSREHTDNMHTNKSTKQGPKGYGSVSTSKRDAAKLKEKNTLADTYDDKKIKKSNKNKSYAKEMKASTPPLSLHSKSTANYKNSTPNLKLKEEKNFTPPRENNSRKDKHTVVIIKTEKMSPPLEDSPSGNLKKSAIYTNDSSPNTDDYSDNWENDDEELLMTSAAFLKLNQIEQISKNRTSSGRFINSSHSPSLADSADSESNSKIQSTTPKNSPPPQTRLSPLPGKKNNTMPKAKSPKVDSNNDTSELSEMQLLYNQFIKSVESADLKLTNESVVAGNDETTSVLETNKQHENEHLSTSSTSYSSSSSSSSDTSASSSASSSTTSSSDSASEDSNDADTLCKDATTTTTINNENNTKTNVHSASLTSSEDTTPQLFNMKNESNEGNVAKEMKKLENLEANLLRIQMMRANYDSADEISDELLKMEKLFLHEKNLILNKFMETSSSAGNLTKSDREADCDKFGLSLQTTEESLQLRGQFVQSMQKLQNEDDQPQITNIFDIKRDVIKLTISPVKLPKTSAIFDADNELDNSKQDIEAAENSNATVKQAKPTKEVAIVKPIMESKESSSNHHQKRRRSPLPSHHTNNTGQARSRSRRGRVRSLSVSPTRNSNNGRGITPPRRGGGFSKQSRNRNFDRRSRSRSPSGANRQYNRRLGDISPISRKRRPFANVEDRFRKHSPRRGSRSRTRSRSRSPRHRFGRYSRSPLPFKPPSPPTDPNLSPNNNIRRSSLSPDRHLRSISRSPHRKRTLSPSSNKSYDNNRHLSLSPRQEFYTQQQHSPTPGNNSYYFNNEPNRISLDARINIVLNGSNSSHNENTQQHNIAGYDDYSHYGQYGPAAYMSLPNDPNAFYANQYVSMANAGVPPIHGSHHTIQHGYTNLTIMGNDDTNMYTAMQQHATANASNYYYTRFGTQSFGLNQPSPLLKELPKASAVAVQKGNVLEIVPCNDIIAGSAMAEQKQNENKNVTTTSEQQYMAEETTTSNNDKSNRSILKPLDGETNTVRTASVGPAKKKKVNFEDGVYPNHNSDEEDRKVIEAKIRVKMRRLRKKLGITPQCHSLLVDKIRKSKQKENSNKIAPPPPPPGVIAPPNLEQPVYLRTHTPTPLLYFHFDGVVHSMYVSQMERPIPPRLLNPKCLSTTTTNTTATSHPTDSQSPLYMQSPVNAAGLHNTNKKDPITAFTKPTRTENLSPKVITTTTALHQQPAGTSSPKINFKLYSPIDSTSSTEIASSSPNNMKSNMTMSSMAATSTTLGANHFLPSKRQESPKDAAISGTRTNMTMGGLLPVPIGHPTMPPNTEITPQARIPVIGVPPTAIPKVMSSASEPFMSAGFSPTAMQTAHHPMNSMNMPNSNYQMGISPMGAHAYNPHMQMHSGLQQPYFNAPPIQRMHRPLPNYMVQQQQAQLSPNANLPMGGHHMVDNLGTTNTDLDKFASPQSMTNPFSYKGP